MGLTLAFIPSFGVLTYVLAAALFGSVSPAAGWGAVAALSSCWLYRELS